MTHLSAKIKPFYISGEVRKFVKGFLDVWDAGLSIKFTQIHVYRALLEIHTIQTVLNLNLSIEKHF